MAAPHGHFDDFGKVGIDGHFANFGQVKNWPYSKTPFGETGCLSNFLGYLSMSPALLSGLSDLSRPPPACQTCQDLYLDYFRLPTFLDCLSIQFFDLPFFPTQSVRLLLGTYPRLCSTCVTYRTPCHASSHQVFPIQPLPRKAEDFPRGGKHSKHVLLLTYLAWLQPIINNLKLIFKHVKNKDALLVVKALLVGKSLIKNSGHIN